VADAHRDKYANDFKMAQAEAGPGKLPVLECKSIAAKLFAEMDIFQWLA
jgi:hypothetical protein